MKVKELFDRLEKERKFALANGFSNEQFLAMPIRQVFEGVNGYFGTEVDVQLWGPKTKPYLRIYVEEDETDE